jgi:hypothetical protein
VIPISFSKHEQVLNKPEDWDDSCSPLPVVVIEDSDGARCAVSCWELSEAEKQYVIRTGRVYLGVFGTQHPPVILTPNYEVFGFQKEEV